MFGLKRKKRFPRPDQPDGDIDWDRVRKILGIVLLVVIVLGAIWLATGPGDFFVQGKIGEYE